jgi:hypothetical protein
MVPQKQPRKPSFRSLDEALAFIEKRLEDDELDGLFGACREDRESDYMRGLILEHPRQINAEVGLRALYLDCSRPMAFPQDAEAFKLGGHNKELGHIHIDFRKVGARWQLEAIWKCR